MQTIVLATQKGGSGKSTLAIGLALAAIQAGHTVRLIETDSQGTLSNWQSRRVYAELARLVDAREFFWERDFNAAFAPGNAGIEAENPPTLSGHTTTLSFMTSPHRMTTF